MFEKSSDDHGLYLRVNLIGKSSRPTRGRGDFPSFPPMTPIWGETPQSPQSHYIPSSKNLIRWEYICHTEYIFQRYLLEIIYTGDVGFSAQITGNDLN